MRFGFQWNVLRIWQLSGQNHDQWNSRSRIDHFVDYLLFFVEPEFALRCWHIVFLLRNVRLDQNSQITRVHCSLFQSHSDHDVDSEYCRNGAPVLDS